MPEEGSDWPTLTLSVVYDDLPDLIEVQARVVFGDWSGISGAFINPDSLCERARRLLAWSLRPSSEFAIEAGADTGMGWLHLRWYMIDRAAHLACHVQIAMRKESDRPEGVRRLSLEFHTQPLLVERFARQLVSVATSLTGEAVLAGSGYWSRVP